MARDAGCGSAETGSNPAASRHHRESEDRTSFRRRHMGAGVDAFQPQQKLYVGEVSPRGVQGGKRDAEEAGLSPVVGWVRGRRGM